MNCVNNEVLLNMQHVPFGLSYSGLKIVHNGRRKLLNTHYNRFPLS